MRYPVLGLITASMLLSGCQSRTAYEAPSVALPGKFHFDSAQTAAQPVAVGPQWWRAFDDPMLDRLQAEALASNLDIEIAKARLEQAAAGARAARGAALPQASLETDGAIKRQSLDDPDAQLASRFPGFERTVEQYGLDGAASWEIDLFGRLGAATRAARAEAQGAQAGLAGAELTIAAEVANAYITVRELQQRLRINQARAQALADIDRLTTLRHARGVATLADIDRTSAETSIVRAAVQALEAALVVEANRLDILLGRAPGRALAQIGDGAIPVPPAIGVSDSPASLLRNRPDVVAAERAVAAADARVAEAIVARYPSLTVSGFIGFLASGLSGLLTGDTLQTGGSAVLSAPLFTGGRLRAGEDQQRGRLRESVAAYRLTALRAAGESVDALTALARRSEQARHLDAAASSLGQALQRSTLAQRAGMASIIDVLDVERQLLGAQDNAATARAESARAAVATFRALGGGWRSLVDLPDDQAKRG